MNPITRFILHLFITGAVLLLAGQCYWLITRNQAGYGIFDLLGGKQLAAVTPVAGQAGQPLLRGEPVMDADDFQVLQTVNSALADLSEAVVHSVVSIDTKTTVNVQRVIPTDPFGMFGYRQNQLLERPGLGSGAIVSKDGYILTNHHVVAGVDEIQVTTHEGETFEAEWVGSDPNSDIAVLKIRPPEGARDLEFRPLPFGDSDEVRVGEMALAIGNPFGLNETVTRGIISAKQRRLSDGSNEYFQVDAVINPGNSGGPLVNIRGEIIGVNVAIFTGQQDVKVWQGIGLAIPSNEAKAVYDAIVHGRPLERGYLGVYLEDLSERFARVLQLPIRQGALIRDVAKGSPAEESGMLAGDVVIGFDGKRVNEAEDLISGIRRKKRGETAKIRVIREGEELVLTPRFVSKSDTNTIQLKRSIKENGQTISQALGIKVQDLTSFQRTAMGLDDEIPAIIISEVEEGSQAESRFRPGDLIHLVNRERVTSVGKFYDILGALPRDKSSIMILSRDGNRFAAVLNP